MSSQCLEHQLCFKLYALSRAITNRYRPVLEVLDITYPQYLVLLVLWQEESITVKELGLRLFLDSGTLTPLLKRLSQKGFIISTRNHEDGRSVIITLSEAGKSLQEEAKKIPEAMGKCFIMEDGAYDQLKKQADKLLNRLTLNNLEKN